ncbi:MAG: hypothetical protein KDE48_12475 [Anaerolineales bacterium]|nr:hypothetical protein [Anaerolineales bacterium]
MKLCKAELPNGKLCPNNVDEGQEYCPYHLASQDAETKKTLSILAKAGVVLMSLVAGIYKVATNKKI